MIKTPKNSPIGSLLTGALVLALSAGASAHNIDIEIQAQANEGHANGHDVDWKSDKRADRGKAVENFSWSYPYDVTQDVPVVLEVEDGETVYEVVEDGEPTWLGGILTSRATFGYLDGSGGRGNRGNSPNHPDVDVFNFTVKIGYGPGTDTFQAQQVPDAAAFGAQGLTVVAASPIPPACEEARNDYPAIALTVPCSLMTDPTGAPLPGPFPGAPPVSTVVMGPGAVEDVPFATGPLSDFAPQIFTAPALNGQAMCIAQVAFNVPSEDRVVFHEPHTNNAWFMPNGCSVEPFLDCSSAPGIFYLLPAGFMPFDYTNQLVVWNPTGERIDYTLNTGFAEGHPWIAHNHDLEEEIEENAWVTHACTPVQ